MASEEKIRVDFNAPASLVEEADLIAELLDISRTQLLIDALRDEIEDLASDEAFQRTISTAYYTGEIDFDVVESILGTEEAMRMRLLNTSLNRDPPAPRIEGSLPSEEAFYVGAVPEVDPTDDAADSEAHD